MTLEESLVVSIQKAVKNGYDEDVGGTMVNLITSQKLVLFSPEGMLTLRGFLTDQEFAKALWPGEIDRYSGKIYELNQPGIQTLPAWEYHLQRMVIAPNLLRYMQENP